MTSTQIAGLLTLSCVAGLAALGRAPYRDEFPTVPRRLAALALWLLVLAVIVFLPVASLQDGAGLDPATLEFPTLFIGHALICLVLLAWWRLRPDLSWTAFLEIQPGPLAGRIAHGIWIGLLGWGLTVTINALAVGTFADTAAATPTEVPPVMHWIADLPVARKLLIIGVAMTVEEGFFRGFLQPRVGLLISSVLFALSHFSYGLPFLVVGVFTISLVLGVTFARTRDLVPCIVAHGVFDAIQLLVVLPWAVRNLAATA